MFCTADGRIVANRPMNNQLDPAYLDSLVCPRDRGGLRQSGMHWLTCAAGHEYPVVDGVPVMLLDDAKQTTDVARASLRLARASISGNADVDPLFAESLGLSDIERQGIRQLAAAPRSGLDPAVAYLVGATNGMAYRHLIGKLTAYPIPELRLPPGMGQILLDIGCNWGRWAIAAARRGYQPLGIDPSLGAIMAARRVARSLGIHAHYVVGDARRLPFRDSAVDVVFSYSVIQHFSYDDAVATISEARRVLRPGGESLIQMPTMFGLRCLYQQARRRFRKAQGFEVRYWTVPALRRLFSALIGPTATTVDCYFGIGLQPSDRHLMPPSRRIALDLSEQLRTLSQTLPLLAYAADSIYLASRKSDRDHSAQ